MARKKRLKAPRGFLIRGGIYYVRTDPITKGKLSTGCHDEEAAVAWRDQRERQAQNPAIVASRMVTVGDCCDALLDAKRAGKVTAETVEFNRRKLLPIRRVFGEKTPLCDITPATFDRYSITRSKEPGKKGRGVRGYTITRELRVFMQGLRRSKRAKEFDGDLEALMPADLEASYKPVDRALSEEEVMGLLLNLPTDKWAAFAAVCIALGIRKKEARRIRPEDIEERIEATVDTNGNQILGPNGNPVFTKRYYVAVAGTKTFGSNRIVPVLGPFTALLRSAIPSLPIGVVGNVWRTFGLACRKAGIAHCSPNDLRRTWASLCGAKGVSDEFLAKILGHTSIAMARRVYNQAKASQLAPVVERILSQASPIEIEGFTSKSEGSVPGRKRTGGSSSEGSNGAGSTGTPGSMSGTPEVTETSHGAHQCSKTCASPAIRTRDLWLRRPTNFERNCGISRGNRGISERKKTRLGTVGAVRDDKNVPTDSRLTADADRIFARPIFTPIGRNRSHWANVQAGYLVPVIGPGLVTVGFEEVTRSDLERDLAPRSGGVVS